jgi:dUTP pyrophosphatase
MDSLLKSLVGDATELLGSSTEEDEQFTSNPPLTRATKYSAGYDLPSIEERVIPPNASALIETGITIKIPRGYLMKIFGRSSLAFGRLRSETEIANAISYSSIVEIAGVIDADYTGTIKVGLHNYSDEPFRVKVGDKIAQGVLLAYYTFDNEIVIHDDDFKHEGFGSSN